jgi:two-component sensor histidine kinase
MADDDMPPAWDEGDRLAVLRSYRILDTPPEPAFDDLVRLAGRLCRAPVALISLIEDRRQWFKAEIGLGLRETPLDISICSKAMMSPGLTVVPDLSRDGRFSCNSLVTGDPQFRFYAGVALTTPEDLPLGTLCVLDRVPRELSEEQASSLVTLARQVMSQLELRRAILERDEALAASRQAEERQALLVRELHHRVRNSLAMVQALVGATARSAGTIQEFQRSFAARINSLAKTQTLLTEDYWQTALLSEMIRSEFRPFDEPGQRRFTLNGPRVELSADLAVPVGMALHELSTNAVKYGALSVAAGRVDVSWTVRTTEAGRRLHLDWTETGGPPVRPPRRQGFGSTLLQRVLPMQSNAQVELDFDQAGLRCRIVAPMVERRLVPEY